MVKSLLKKKLVFTMGQQAALALLVVFLFSYLFYIIFFVPQSEKIAQLEAERKTEQLKQKSMNDFVVDHPNIEDYLVELDQTSLQQNALLPNEPAVSAFLLLLQQAANDSNVELLIVTPGPFLGKGAYYEIPLEVGVRGSFFQILSFIEKSESLSRFASLQAINMKVKKGGLECKIPLIIYTFGSPPNQ